MRRRAAVVGLVLAVFLGACARKFDQVNCKLKTQGDHGPNETAYRVCVSKYDYERGLDEQHERDVQACAQGARPECLRAGLRDKASDKRRALREFETACGDDLPDGCYQAALMLRESARLMSRSPPDGMPPTAATMQEADRRFARARSYLEQACRARWQSACDELARPQHWP